MGPGKLHFTQAVTGQEGGVFASASVPTSQGLDEGSGCTDPANIAQRMLGQVVVRGPGNLAVGYCALQSTAATASSPALTLRASARAASLVPVEVVFNPTSSPVTTASGLVVPAGDYDVTFTPAGGVARSLVGALPVVPSGLYPASWVSSSGMPKQLVFGWVASTGSITDFPEIDNVVVSSVNLVPVLAVSQTSYGVDPSAGQPAHLYGHGQLVGGGGKPAGDRDRYPAGRGAAGRRLGYGGEPCHPAASSRTKARRTPGSRWLARSSSAHQSHRECHRSGRAASPRCSRDLTMRMIRCAWGTIG